MYVPDSKSWGRPFKLYDGHTKFFCLDKMKNRINIYAAGVDIIYTSNNTYLLQQPLAFYLQSVRIHCTEAPTICSFHA